jgi:HAD superfamily hydrolase (TIGR01509 family)
MKAEGRRNTGDADGLARRLVVFDLGRVLVRICDGWQHAFEVAGVTLPLEIDADVRARLLAHVCRIEVGDGDVETFCRQAAADIGISCEAMTAMWRGYTRGPYDGAGELLDELKRRGVTTACLSNTNAEHWRVLTDPADPHGPVLARLDHRFASHLVRSRKPEPQIYEHLERQTGVAPGQILFFDDVAANVEAARARGWAAHVVELCDNPVPRLRERLCESGIL